MRIRGRVVAFVIMLFSLAVHSGVAQSTFGSIVGAVQDQTGATVQQAIVEVRNQDENHSQQITTGEDGGFIILNLKPGTYELSVQAKGFGKTVISNIHLDARQERRINLQLKVEATGQIVEVSSDSVAIDTENATISSSLSSQQVSELPLNYRGNTTSPLSVIQASPGVQLDNGGKISVGGVMPTSVQYTVDGVSTNNIRHSGPLTNTYPSTESIAEFKVSYVDNNAEFAEVGDVTFSTKSGTNHYHGSAFEYLQNSALDANALNTASKPRKVANTFGVSLGGPMSLPKHLGSRDSTFFFVDYEGSRLHKESPERFIVPTAAERSGNLNSLNLLYLKTDLQHPNGIPQLVDPLNSTPNNLVFFANNTITNINPVARNLLSYIPLPTPGVLLDDGTNYLANVPTPIDTNGYDIRIDRTLTSKQQIFGRWSWKDVNSKTVNPLLPTSNVAEKDRSLTLSYNYVLSPSLLNELRFGFSYWNSNENFPIAGSSAAKTLGLTGLDLTQHPSDGGFPYFDFSNIEGFTQIGHAVAGATQSTTIQFADNFSWIFHHNTLKFGGDAHLIGYHDVEHFSQGDDFGTFTFQQAGFTGSAFGDFLLGLPYSTYNATTGPNLDSQSTHLGFFAQDEYQANSHLTISVGLRWELHPPFSEAHGNITNFDFAKDAVIVPDHTLAPSAGFLNSINLCPGGTYGAAYYDPSYACTKFETASQAGLGQGLGTNYYANFNPRFGVAYRPFADSKTVIRTGIGLFTAGGFGTRSALLSGVHTANTENYTNFSGVGVAPAYQFPSAYAGNGYGAIGMAMFMCGVDPHLRDPISAQWNLTFERQLRDNTVARLSYIGMNSYRLENMEDINQPMPSKHAFNPSDRPWNNWDMVHMLGNNAGANYQALQAEVNHHARGGLSFQGSYSLAKNLTNAEGTAQLIPGFPYEAGATYTNRFDHRGDRGNDFAVRRHRVLLTGLYELPFGNGRAFLGSAGRITNAIVGNWQLSTITLLQTGPFLTPIEAITDDPANIGVESPVAGCHETATRPDRIGNPNKSHPTPSNYFNNAAFVRAYGANYPAGADPAHVNLGRDGNAGVGILKGPGTIAVALGLAKEISLGGEKRLRFESTFSNLPNHVNWAPPGIDLSNGSTFGKTSSAQTAENAGNRTGQLALRLDF